MVYFFLSYSRQDHQQHALAFFEDLRAEVRSRAGSSPDEEVGFIDNGIQPGHRWPDDLRQALNRCDSFIALTSPSYYNSEYCGKELRTFLDRLAEHERVFGRRPGTLFQLRWNKIDMSEVPATVSEYQMYVCQNPSRYYDEGVRMMIQRRRRSVAYDKFLLELADRIVTATRKDQMLSSAVPPLHQIEPLFPAQRGPLASVNSETWSDRTGFVHFVVASASRDELRNVRHDLSYYGASPEDWRPYGEGERPIVDFATVVASEQRYAGGVVRIDRLPDLLRWAAEKRQIVIVIVDAWSPLMARNRDALVEYEATRTAGSAVMVPWSQADREARDNANYLRATLTAVFPRRRLDRDLYREQISTQVAFSESLSGVLVVAQNRILRAGGVGGDTDQPPALSGP